jgi:nitrate/TMAO reductase-like tetraheme cytochrome c subunit
MRRHAVSLLLALAACGHDASTPTLSVAQLEDPQTCVGCHPQHSAQWAASMHAYASDDPVFVALNRRGQREAHLGAFCVKCHAPMAVALGLTDGTSFDPAKLPPAARGVTCFFCHDVAKVGEDHNNGLELALDNVMRGGVADPVASTAHRSRFDEQIASSTNDSRMCGSCHDVVMPGGVALERTFKEWQTTIFAQHDPSRDLPLTCSGCHMKSDPQAAVIATGAPPRASGFHEHLMPGIDEATTPFPGTDMLAAGIARDLDPALTIVGPTPLGGAIGNGGICVSPQNGGTITVRIDTRGTGHMWPSGASHDRRAWLEVVAFDADNHVVFSSGDVPDDKDPDEIGDPNLFAMWDRTVRADGSPAHFFWDVATEKSTLLRAPVTLDPKDPAFDHSAMATFTIGAIASQIDHIAARVRIRAVPRATLRELVASGDLAPELAERASHTLDVAATVRHWTRADADRAKPYTGCIASPFD